jgi:hypothetical protein
MSSKQPTEKKRTFWRGDEELELPHVELDNIVTLKFEVEFVFGDEWTTTFVDSDDSTEPITRSSGRPAVSISVSNTAEIRDYMWSPDFSHGIDYLKEHFPDLAKEMISWLFFIEAPGVEALEQTGDREIRDNQIEAFKGLADKMIRQRIPTKKRGRPRNEGWSVEEMRAFVNDSVELLTDLQRTRKIEVTKSLFVEEYFKRVDGKRSRSNLIRDFDNLAKKAATTWEEIKRKADEKQ